jgi:myo-inositol-1(or 4)-monophosphatase
MIFAVELARRAGELGLNYFRRFDALKIESKGHQDLVSEADREVENFIRKELAARYGRDDVIGEEHAPTLGSSGYSWVIDPIDGTANFVRGIPAWTVVIACAYKGMTIAGVIHDPSTGETFHGCRGGGAFLDGEPIKVSSSTSLRDGSVGTGFSNRREPRNIVKVIDRLVEEGGVFFRNASGALMLAYVASGRLLAYVEEHMNAWDCLAGLMLVEEAGGAIVPPDPKTAVMQGSVVLASCKGVFEDVKAICAGPFKL